MVMYDIDYDKLPPAAWRRWHTSGFAYFHNRLVVLNRDGSSEFVVVGILKMKVNSPKHRFFKFQVESAAPNIQFTPHKAIYKGAFKDDRILGVESPNLPFAKNSRPLKWKLVTKDVSVMPLRIDCQTSLHGNETHVRVEYEASTSLVLQGVVVTVPLPRLVEAPRFDQVDGDWSYDVNESEVEWSVRVRDNSNPIGAMKIVVRDAPDVSKLFKFKYIYLYSWKSFH